MSTIEIEIDMWMLLPFHKFNIGHVKTRLIKLDYLIVSVGAKYLTSVSLFLFAIIIMVEHWSSLNTLIIQIQSRTKTQTRNS